MQRLYCQLWISGHDFQQGAGRTGRLSTFLFPVLQRFDRHADQTRKFRLRQARSESDLARLNGLDLGNSKIVSR